MKIIITKEEAIKAWKDMNADLRLSKDIVIEIERDNFVGISSGIALCGDETNNK